jgi:uncharacterized membrane protein (UPF0127 family)
VSAAIVLTPTISIATPWGEATVAVEVASTQAEIERGLMYRDQLPYDSGMLFLMGGDAVWSFWMRNTLIPLDIIFIARDLTVAGVVPNAEPCTDTLRSINTPSSYVLETNGGWAAAHQITAGAKVRPGHKEERVSA